MWRFFLIVFFVFYGLISAAQSVGPNDTIRLGAIVVGKDTFSMIFLDDAYVHERMPPEIARARSEYTRLRYNVYRVYPYAVVAAYVLKDVDVYLARLPDKAARKAYLKTVEADLKHRFKGKLRTLLLLRGKYL